MIRSIFPTLHRNNAATNTMEAAKVIYLIHPMFLGVFNDLFGRFYLPGIIRTPAEVLVIFAVCAAVIWVISKIPVLNKYII